MSDVREADDKGRPDEQPTAGCRKKTDEEVRMLFQAEQLLLVWVRTCLGLMGFGFVVARFGLFLRELAEAGHVSLEHVPRLARFSSLTGTGLIVLGTVFLVAAVVMHWRFVRALERGDPDFPSRWSLGVILSVALMGLGMVMASFLGLAEL